MFVGTYSEDGVVVPMSRLDTASAREEYRKPKATPNWKQTDDEALKLLMALKREW